MALERSMTHLTDRPRNDLQRPQKRFNVTRNAANANPNMLQKLQRPCSKWIWGWGRPVLSLQRHKSTCAAMQMKCLINWNKSSIGSIVSSANEKCQKDQHTLFTGCYDSAILFVLCHVRFIIQSQCIQNSQVRQTLGICLHSVTIGLQVSQAPSVPKQAPFPMQVKQQLADVRLSGTLRCLEPRHLEISVCPEGWGYWHTTTKRAVCAPICPLNQYLASAATEGLRFPAPLVRLKMNIFSNTFQDACLFPTPWLVSNHKSGSDWLKSEN